MAQNEQKSSSSQQTFAILVANLPGSITPLHSSSLLGPRAPSHKIGGWWARLIALRTPVTPLHSCTIIITYGSGKFPIPLLFSGLSRFVSLVRRALASCLTNDITLICGRSWKLRGNKVAHNIRFILIKRFSVALQKGNAASFHNTMVTE